jgi:hypothetical protein
MATIGASTSSATTTAGSLIDAWILIDNAFVQGIGVGRMYVTNSGPFTMSQARTTLQATLSIAPGNHTFSMCANGNSIASVAGTAGGAANSANQAAMSVLLLKQ